MLYEKFDVFIFLFLIHPEFSTVFFRQRTLHAQFTTHNSHRLIDFNEALHTALHLFKKKVRRIFHSHSYCLNMFFNIHQSCQCPIA